MNWQFFNTHNSAPEDAFEALCCQIFENWCKEQYKNRIKSIKVVNGSGGDGGVEAYATLTDESVIGLQAKWFINSIGASQVSQIKKSIITAIKIRPKIFKYIVCVPRNICSITGKNKINENSNEEERLNKLFNEFPNIEIDLWDDNKLSSQLQLFNNSGILSYWFNKSIVLIDHFKQSFEKNKSWLTNKYVPDLVESGRIEDVINIFCGSETLTNDAINVFERYFNLAKNLVDEIEDFLTIDITNEVILNSVKEIQELTIKSMCLCNTIIDAIKSPIFLGGELNFSAFDIDFYNLKILLSNDNDGNFKYFSHYNELIKKIDKIDACNIYKSIQYIKNLINPKNILFIGNPGTGKTCGFANMAQKYLECESHISLLIRAKNIDDKFSWKDILIQALDLPNDWSEIEILGALDSLLNQKQIENLKNGKNLIPKVIIMVDGLDESSNYEYWIEKISESNIISQKHKRIIFSFSSRPLVFENIYAFSNFEVITLSNNGDVPVYKIFDKYIKYYNITLKNKELVMNSLETPLCLKMFCELYKDKTYVFSDNAALSFEELLKRKIDLIEKDFCKKNAKLRLNKNEYVLKAILYLSNIFTTEEQIEFNDLKNALSKELFVNNDIAYNLIEILETYGIICGCVKHSKGLKPNLYFYTQGIQGYFDYTIALSLINKYKTPLDINFDELNSLSLNFLYILSILAIKDYGVLITSNKTLKINSNLHQQLVYYSLRNCRSEYANEKLRPLLRIMRLSSHNLISIVNEVVLPLSRNLSHPFGANLLNTFLSSFEFSAQRDKLWSIQGYLEWGYDNSFYSYENLYLDQYPLNEFDKANGTPLVYAWALSNVDNTKRQKYRSELMKWAILQPEEFFELIIHFLDVNDMQIKSDLFSILMCCVYQSNDNNFIKKVSVWIMNNILSKSKINNNRNIAIRYYSIAILRRTQDRGIVLEDLSNYMPPYIYEPYDIQLDSDALSGNTGGYKSITYDLARYVLVDKIHSCFRENYECAGNDYDSLLRKVEAFNNIDTKINSMQFCISAAYKYLLNQGWNESEFSDYRNKEKIGIDVAIHRTYIPATHGSQSQVMTICEKYIWQARNEILGFLSDNLKHFDWDYSCYIEDYGKLDDFVIPLQEIDRQINKVEVFFPEPIATNKSTSPKDIIESAKKLNQVNIEKWIFIEDKSNVFKLNTNNIMALNGFMSIDSKDGLKRILNINSLLIDSDKVDVFLKDIQKDKKIIVDAFKYDDLIGNVDSYCYITPKEVCWFSWKKCFESIFAEQNSKYGFITTVDKCCYHQLEEGDIYCYLPSRWVREKLFITDTIGNLYYNDKKEVVANFYFVEDEKQSYVFVNKDNFFSLIKKENKSIIWFVNLIIRETLKTREKFKDFYIEKIEKYIVYQSKNGNLEKKIISEEFEKSQ